MEVLLLEDHPMFRLGLRHLLESESSVRVCGEAASASAGLDHMSRHGCSLVIADLSLGESHGLEFIERVRKESDVPIIVLSMHDEKLYAPRCLAAGANGYVAKHEAADRIVTAVQRVLAGGIALSEQAKDAWLEQSVGRGSRTAGLAELSNRELQVFELIGQGEATRVIAERLFISVKTVDTHRRNISQKLGLSSSSALLRAAIAWAAYNRPPEHP